MFISCTGHTSSNPLLVLKSYSLWSSYPESPIMKHVSGDRDDDGQNATFSFMADTVGGFTYYCRYDLPSMIGHLEVLL